MTRIRTEIFCVTLAVVTLTGAVSAHHGTNISYDHDKPLTLTGTVTEFVWRNPHAQLYSKSRTPAEWFTSGQAS